MTPPLDAYDPRFDEIFRRLEPDERTDRMNPDVRRPTACSAPIAPSPAPLGVTFEQIADSLAATIAELKDKLKPVLNTHPFASGLCVGPGSTSPMRSTAERLYESISELQQIKGAVDL